MFIQQTVSDLVGALVYPIPLENCRLTRPYLLEHTGISSGGTALFFAIPYLIAADVADPTRNISLYAVPRDYHLYVQQLADRVLPALREAHPGIDFALFSDHSPVLEGEAAARAGMGVMGLHHLLITPDYGSFVFIAEVITGADYMTVTGQTPPPFPDTPPTCPGCGVCRSVCPATDADGHRSGPCLSSLTQQKKALTDKEQEQLRAHPLIWGCDTCQLACPLNAAVLSGQRDTPIPFFREERMIRLTPRSLDCMTDEVFSKYAFAWRGRGPLLRNMSLHPDTIHETEADPC